VVNRPSSSNDPDIPRFFGEKPLLGWKAVIDKVHADGGVMAPQLWHMGVVAPKSSTWLPPAPFEGPSGYVAPGKVGGVAMTEHDIADTIRAFAEAATQAKTLDSMRLRSMGARLFNRPVFLAPHQSAHGLLWRENAGGTNPFCSGAHSGSSPRNRTGVSDLSAYLTMETPGLYRKTRDHTR